MCFSVSTYPSCLNLRFFKKPILQVLTPDAFSTTAFQDIRFGVVVCDVQHPVTTITHRIIIYLDQISVQGHCGGRQVCRGLDTGGGGREASTFGIPTRGVDIYRWMVQVEAPWRQWLTGPPCGRQPSGEPEGGSWTVTWVSPELQGRYRRQRRSNLGTGRLACLP
jgi:hypothetical protein